MCLERGAGRLTLALTLVLALLCALSVVRAHHKRAEISPAPFTFAARYGRASARLITPRNDRWLMTTRYGKRSELSPLEKAVPATPRAGEGGAGGQGRALYCEFTGVPALYRCAPDRTHAGASGPARALYARRGEADPAAPGPE